MKFTNTATLLLLAILLLNISCSREDEDADVLSQEDISNIILIVKDEITGNAKTYNYTVNSATNPVIKLEDGKPYTVDVIFLNGNDDETESIISAKDEHFLIYDFQGAQIGLTREDGPSATRSDGVKLGLRTRWQVQKARDAASPRLVLTLIHDAVSVSEVNVGTTFGTAEGGETDAVAVFGIDN